MLTTSGTGQILTLIALTVVMTLIIWLGSKWYSADWFDSPYKYPAKAASLVTTVLICGGMLIATRNRTLQGYFKGLDKVYQIHKRIGKGAFLLSLLHPRSWRLTGCRVSLFYLVLSGASGYPVHSPPLVLPMRHT